MAITSSAKKAIRVAARRRVFNVRRVDAMRDSVKALQKAALAKDAKQMQALLPDAYAAIDKAMKRGVIKANTAARKKARLAGLLRKAA